MSTDDTGNAGQKQSIKDYAVRNSKDAAFAFVFSEAHTLADLYRGVANKEISAEDIEPLNLDKLLQRQKRYNDAAFRTKDNRLIVFVEHMSTKSKNMPYRLLEYYVDLMRIWDVMDGKDRYATELINPPKVEFYVAYNGRKHLDTADKTLYVDLGAIQVKVLVADIHFDKLPEDRASDVNNTLSGYAYFVKVFESKKCKGSTPYEAFTFAVGECLAKGYLTEILSRKESFDMFAEKYCYDDHLREAGREEGLEEGLLIAAARMLESGMSLQQIASILRLTDEQLKDVEAIPV